MEILEGWPILAARMLLAAIFLFSGLAKLAAPDDFSRAAIRLTGLTSSRFRRAIGVLPWFELTLAVALASGISAWATAIVAVMVLFLFSVILATGMARGTYAPCNCFGRLLPHMSGRMTLIRNSVLILIAVVPAVGEPDQLSRDLDETVTSISAADSWLIALAAVGILLGLAVMGQAATTFGREVNSDADTHQPASMPLSVD